MSYPKEMKKRIMADVEKQVDKLIESSDGSPRCHHRYKIAGNHRYNFAA